MAGWLLHTISSLACYCTPLHGEYSSSWRLFILLVCLNFPTPSHPQICDEQAAELRRAEQQLAAVEGALQQRTGQAQALQARVAELEGEAESARHEQRTFGSAYAAKERDTVRRIEGLQDEVEHQQEQVAALEKLLRERSGQLSEAKDKVSNRVLVEEANGWRGCVRSHHLF